MALDLSSHGHGGETYTQNYYPVGNMHRICHRLMHTIMLIRSGTGGLT